MSKRLTLCVGLLVLSIITTTGVLRSSTPDEPNLRSLADQRVAIARRAFEAAEANFKEPAGVDVAVSGLSIEKLERVIAWSRRWLDAQFDGSDSRELRVAAIRDHIARLEKWSIPLREQARASLATGVSPSHADLVEYYVLEAKSALVKEQGASK